MNEKKTGLIKFLSILFIIFAVLDLLVVLMSALVIAGAVTSSELAILDQANLKGSLVVYTILLVFNAFFELYLGSKGLKQVKGTYNGDEHIKVSLWLMIIEAICLVLSVVSLVTGNGDWSTIVSRVLTIIVIYFYRDACIKARA